MLLADIHYNKSERQVCRVTRRDGCDETPRTVSARQMVRANLDRDLKHDLEPGRERSERAP